MAKRKTTVARNGIQEVRSSILLSSTITAGDKGLSSAYVESELHQYFQSSVQDLRTRPLSGLCGAYGSPVQPLRSASLCTASRLPRSLTATNAASC